MLTKSFKAAAILLCTLFVSFSGYAQNRQVTGVVTDASGEPLIGAGVVIEGQATTGVVTDLSGNYTINLPENATALRFTFIGFDDIVEQIAGRTVINVTMQESGLLLDGVVFTALGIKRAERSVTYNVQKLPDGAFDVRQANMVNSLQGKLAGVQINTTSAGAGSETKVVMRGSKSISGSNNALYVLDGIPLPALSLTNPGDSWSIYGGSGASGDGISNFNPEDIADMSALVGPSAAALYGSKAANGILMLTSRTGEKGFGVTYSNNTTFSSPLMLPDLQRTYGAVEGDYMSWGNKMTTSPTWKTKDFFQTGYNTQNSVALSMGGENSTTYVSASMAKSRGIIPNNNYKRYNFTAKHTADFLDDKMHLSVLAMHMRISERNMLSGGQYYNPLVALYLMSPSDDLQKYSVYERYDAERNFPVQYWETSQLAMQNPFWTINRNIFENEKTRTLLGASLTYDIADWVDIQGRARTDMNNTIAEQKNYASTNGLFAGQFGRYWYNTYNTNQVYADVLANFHKDFDEKYQLNGVLGASIETYNYTTTEVAGDLLGVANLFTFANMGNDKAYNKEKIQDQTQSIFATAQVGYKNMVFLDLTGRYDWTSAMADANGVKPFFYPSVGLTAIVTDIFDIHSDLLTFAKVRASYAEVGNAPMRFILNPTRSISGGVPTTNTYGVADDFKPERTKSFEFGADARLFKSKLILAATYYNSKTFNQVFNPQVSGASGYSTVYINSGRIDNHGIELSAEFKQNLGPVEWTTNLVYSRNRNKIVDMLDATFNGEHITSDQLNVGGSTGVKMWLVKGGQIGDVYVSTLKTDEHGYIWVSPTGINVTPAANDGTPATLKYAGNVNPSWTGSWRNSFSWKGLNAAVLINARVGGVGVSLTEATLDAFGVSQRTADARDAGGALVNGQRIGAKDFYTTISGGDGVNAIGAYYTYSMTNVRLGEISLGYDIPVNKWCNWIKGLNVSFVGRDLLMLYCKAPFDPEQISNAGNYGSGIDLFMAPSTRNLGFSATVKF